MVTGRPRALSASPGNAPPGAGRAAVGDMLASGTHGRNVQMGKERHGPVSREKASDEDLPHVGQLLGSRRGSWGDGDRDSGRSPGSPACPAEAQSLQASLREGPCVGGGGGAGAAAEERRGPGGVWAPTALPNPETSLRTPCVPGLLQPQAPPPPTVPHPGISGLQALVSVSQGIVGIMS